MAYSTKIMALAVMIFAAVFSASAWAGNKGNPGSGKGAKSKADGVSIEANIELGDHERHIVRDYYDGRQTCPPGLAKKNNGCLPPGIAKKRYEIGRRIYDDAIVIELPHDIIVRLPSLAPGYGYRVVDGDLVVVALATMIVLDAIGLY